MIILNNSQYFLLALCAGITNVLPKLTKVLPPSLVGLVVSSLVAIGMKLPVSEGGSCCVCVVCVCVCVFACVKLLYLCSRFNFLSVKSFFLSPAILSILLLSPYLPISTVNHPTLSSFLPHSLSPTPLLFSLLFSSLLSSLHSLSHLLTWRAQLPSLAAYPLFLNT